MEAHSSTIAWKMPWTEEPGRLQSMGSQRVRHDWATPLSFFLPTCAFQFKGVFANFKLSGWWTELAGRTSGWWTELTSRKAILSSWEETEWNLNVFPKVIYLHPASSASESLKVKSESELTQLCSTLCDSMDYSLPGSSVHGIFPGKKTGVGCHFLLQEIFQTQGLNPGLLHCRQTLYHLSHEGSQKAYYYYY